LERQLAQDGDEDYDVFMAIAEKLGFPKHLLNDAQQHLSGKTDDLQKMLDLVEKRRIAAEKRIAQADSEKSRAKERIFSFRDRYHQWDPKNQRPELWDIYNTKVHKGESDRTRYMAIHPS